MLETITKEKHKKKKKKRKQKNKTANEHNYSGHVFSGQTLQII
jgi:hypothetical protein